MSSSVARSELAAAVALALLGCSGNNVYASGVAGVGRTMGGSGSGGVSGSGSTGTGVSSTGGASSGVVVGATSGSVPVGSEPCTAVLGGGPLAAPVDLPCLLIYRTHYGTEEPGFELDFTFPDAGLFVPTLNAVSYGFNGSAEPGTYGNSGAVWEASASVASDGPDGGLEVVSCSGSGSMLGLLGDIDVQLTSICSGELATGSATVDCFDAGSLSLQLTF
jgi:hypothetical protein